MGRAKGALVVVFGAGSPIVVDVEESCRRNGLSIVAIIQNFDGPVFAMDTARVIALDDVSDALLENSVIVPLFTPANRKFAVDQAVARGARRFDPIIDKTAIVPHSLVVASGVYINSGVTIGAASRLGAFAFVNRGASLGHHLEIAEYASVGPAVATGGDVKIGRGAVIGTGAVVLPGLKIGDNAVVGAGSVVTRDVAPNTVVFGNPARVIKTGIAGYHNKGV